MNLWKKVKKPKVRFYMKYYEILRGKKWNSRLDRLENRVLKSSFGGFPLSKDLKQFENPI